jgi:UDP-glucose 4-epimerase
MKVAIIGANGYIGENLSKYLDNNYEVIKYTSRGDNSIFNENGLIKESFELPSDTDVVIYLSQSPFYRDVPDSAWHLFNVNQTSAIQVANIARKSGVKKFIYTSTGNVYTKSLKLLDEESILNYEDWYALSKVNAENGLLLFKNDMDIKIYRLFVVYGENQSDKLIPNIINSIKNKKEINLNRSSLDNEYDGLNITLSYIDNICDIIEQGIAQDIDENIFNINHSEILTLREVTNKISSLVGIEPIFKLQDNLRDMNLISDNGKLSKYFNLSKFSTFDTNLQKII